MREANGRPSDARHGCAGERKGTGEASTVKAQRLAKIDHEIQRILGVLISQELQDPRLSFVTVTRAEVSDDLRHCKVFVSIIGDRHAARQSLDALKHAGRFLRGELGRKIDLRHTPELSFVEDRSAERAIALAKALREDAEAQR
jgi:ribosome-binding factor A